MFLKILNESEQHLFINLLFNAAKIDSNFSNNEREHIAAYAAEMGLSLKDEEEYSRDNSSLIDELKSSEEITKKSMFIELVALMYTDGLHQTEKVLLKEVQDKFGFSQDYTSDVMEWTKKIIPLYKEGFNLAGLQLGGK